MRIGVLLAAVWIPALLSGCARWRAAEPSPEPARLAAPAPSVLRVSLSFGDAADLDLYVTDPAHETVYYGNSPTRSGGRLESDQRCGAPAPRVETVRFDRPVSGVYRVGVDYPERCRSARDPIPFRVVVETTGHHEQRGGSTSLGQFQPLVVEFELRCLATGACTLELGQDSQSAGTRGR